MNRGTRVKLGTLVKLRDDMPVDPRYQTAFWDNDAHFLRDPDTMQLSKRWISGGEVCLVVGQDLDGLVVLNPRSQVGWIGKERMEVVK